MMSKWNMTQNGKRRYNKSSNNRGNGMVSTVRIDEPEKEVDFEVNETSQISRRKLRKLNKPNLIYLKNQILYPEVFK